jgi:hypothetical protein
MVDASGVFCVAWRWHFEFGLEARADHSIERFVLDIDLMILEHPPSGNPTNATAQPTQKLHPPPDVGFTICIITLLLPTYLLDGVDATDVC